MVTQLNLKEVLRKAFAAIPEEIIPKTVHPDHAIICYESYKVSQRVGGLAPWAQPLRRSTTHKCKKSDIQCSFGKKVPFFAYVVTPIL